MVNLYMYSFSGWVISAFFSLSIVLLWVWDRVLDKE